MFSCLCKNYSAFSMVGLGARGGHSKLIIGFNLRLFYFNLPLSAFNKLVSKILERACEHINIICGLKNPSYYCTYHIPCFYLCDCYATMNGVFEREKDACRWQVSRVTNKATMLLLVEFHVLCRET